MKCEKGLVDVKIMTFSFFICFFAKKKRENDHELKKAVTKYDNGRFCSGFTEKVSLGQYKDPTSLAFTLTAGDIFL